MSTFSSPGNIVSAPRSLRGQTRKLLFCAGTIICFSASLLSNADAQVLPPNPAPTCTVTSPTFQSWFDVKPGLNEPVKAANSIGLNTSKNCNFYAWSEQMFLWLTSPAKGIYQGNRILDSQVFFQVNDGYLVSQSPFGPRNLALRAAKSGPDGLPVVITANGHLREFVTASPKTSITTLEMVGGDGAAEVAAVRLGADGKAIFLDANGKSAAFTPRVTVDMLPLALDRLAALAEIPREQAALTATNARQQIANALTAKKVLIAVATRNGTAFIEAGSGIIENLGPGQAGGNGALVSQGNALVFYEVLVNDVYAWYLTGRKTPNGIAPFFVSSNPATNGYFPTSETDLLSILKFSAAHAGPSSFPDQQALAIEAKLSWVEASTLPNNGQGYITAPALLPRYDTKNSTDWSPMRPSLATVALVGAHVVGSANGHPEMIWATFEHQANTPLAAFSYTSGGRTVNVAQTTSGTWLFSTDGASGNYNSELAVLCPNGTSQCSTSQANHIIANTSAAIGPSNILREKAWGVASDGTPNQEDATPAAANTEVISLDTDVRAKLKAAGAATDPRYNYLLIGATWTLSGGEPTNPYPEGGNANEIGTSMLANSTMETFMQGSDTTSNTGTNCFSCHVSSGSNPQAKANTAVSHFFASIKPLSPFTPANGK